MPTSAAGNERSGAAPALKSQPRWALTWRGFTLIELLIVLLIIAIGSAGVTFAFRDSQTSLLEREAQRLSVVLETARVQSRSSGVALAWVPLPQGYVVLPAKVLAQSRELPLQDLSVSPWLSNEVRVQILSQGAGAGVPEASARSAPNVLLGAEPMIAPSTVVLSLGDRQLLIATDGLRPFEVQVMAQTAGQP